MSAAAFTINVQCRVSWWVRPGVFVARWWIEHGYLSFANLLRWILDHGIACEVRRA